MLLSCPLFSGAGQLPSGLRFATANEQDRNVSLGIGWGHFFQWVCALNWRKMHKKHLTLICALTAKPPEGLQWKSWSSLTGMERLILTNAFFTNNCLQILRVIWMLYEEINPKNTEKTPLKTLPKLTIEKHYLRMTRKGRKGKNRKLITWPKDKRMHKHGLANVHEPVKPILLWDLKEHLDEFGLIFLSFLVLVFWFFSPCSVWQITERSTLKTG